MTRRTALVGGAMGALSIGAAGVLASPADARKHQGEGHRNAKGFRGAKTLVLEPSWVVTDDNGVLNLRKDHSVVVERGRIAAIRPGRLRGRETRLPMTGQLLIPGMISGHTHVSLGALSRGFMENGEPGISAIGPALETLAGDDLDALTAYNLFEILRGGCTTQVDQALSLGHFKSYVRIARDWGVRGYPFGMVPNWSRTNPIRQRTNDQVLFDSEPTTIAQIEEGVGFALSVKGAEGGRILPMVAPQGPETLTPGGARAVKEASRRLGTGIQTHLATGAGDSANVVRLFGKNPVHWVDDFGWYDAPLFGAHLGAWDVPAGDPAFLAGKENFTYAHVPSGSSTGLGGNGRQPFIEALAAGINTCVAIDGDSNNMLEQARLAVIMGRLRYDLINQSSPLPVYRPNVWDMIRCTTSNPAKGLKRDDLGRIAVGAKADLTSIDVVAPFVGVGTPPAKPLNNLLYANGTQVRHVMTEGVIQVMDGELVVDDERRVIKRGAAIANEVWSQFSSEPWFQNPSG